jgi:hypothetical protein
MLGLTLKNAGVRQLNLGSNPFGAGGCESPHPSL